MPENDARWASVKPQGWEELYILADAFKKELEDRVFMYMPAADAEFYQNGRLLTSKAKTAFPKLTRELRSAGNAYACGLQTACVFHCMCAVEHALRALALDVGLRWELEQWHNIIEMIEVEIRKLNQSLPRGAPKNTRLMLLSQAATQFMYFKDGWRNHVMHVRVHYDGPDALEILEHVRDFAEALSEWLRE